MTPSVWFDNWYWINILLFYLTSVFSMSLWRARQNKLENVPCSTFNEWRFTVSKETVVLIRWEIETRKFVLPNESFRFKFPPCENHDWQRATGRSNLQLCDTFTVVICPRMDSFEIPNILSRPCLLKVRLTLFLHHFSVVYPRCKDLSNAWMKKGKETNFMFSLVLEH